MTCCLMAPSHYQNQCRLSINKMLWHSFRVMFTYILKISVPSSVWNLRHFKSQPHLPGDNELIRTTSSYRVVPEYHTVFFKPWWRHQMETFSVLLAFCVGNSPVYRWIPRTKVSDAELWFFSMICAWTNSWPINGDYGDLRYHCAHYDGIVMYSHNINSIAHLQGSHMRCHY